MRWVEGKTADRRTAAAWRSAPCLVVACLVLTLATYLLGENLPHAWSRAPFMVVIGGSAVLASAGAWRWRRRLGPSGFLLAGALVAEWVGDAGYTWNVHLGVDAYPAWTTAAVLPGYVLLLLGTVLLVRRQGGGRDVDAAVDAAIVTTGVGVLAFAFVISDVATSPGVPFSSKAIGVAYPLLDVLTAGVMARFCLARGLARGPVTLLSLAMLSLLLGDAWFTVWTFGGAVGDYANSGIAAFYLLYALLLGSSFWARDAGRPRMHEPARRNMALVRAVALSGAALLAPATLLVEYFSGRPLHVLSTTLGSAVLMVLVTARLLLVVRRVEVQSRELELLARNDSLTGLPNRRSFDHEVLRAVEALQEREPLSLAILDLDHFKSYNDGHGHAAGDELLVEAARCWREELSGVAPRATLARWGGEEFALVLPGHDVEDSVRVVQALLAATPQGQTFSAGVATWNRVETVLAVMSAADEKLYAAKECGRARVHARRDAPVVALLS